MGSGVSTSSDKKFLSEDEVKALAGEHFDKKAFDTLKDAEGFITTQQYLGSASQKIHEGQIFSSVASATNEKEKTEDATNQKIPLFTGRLTRKSFSSASDDSPFAIIKISPAPTEEESLEKSTLALKTLFSKYSSSGNMDSIEFLRVLIDRNLIDDKLSREDAPIVFDAIKSKAVLLGVKGGNITFGVFLTTCIPALATQRGESIPQIMSVLSGQAEFAQPPAEVTVSPTAAMKRNSFGNGSDPVPIRSSFGGGEGAAAGAISVTSQKKSSFNDGVFAAAAAAVASLTGASAAVSSGKGSGNRRSFTGASTDTKSLPPQQRRSFSGEAPLDGGQRRRGNFPLIEVDDPINYKGPGDMIYPVFREFCPSGEMDSSAYTKLLRTAKLFDKQSMFPLAEAETLFRAAKQKLNEPLVISFEIFYSFVIPQIAERRDETEDDIADAISCCNAPPSSIRRSLSIRIRGPDGANAVGIDGIDRPSVQSSGRSKSKTASIRRSFTQQQEKTNV